MTIRKLSIEIGLLVAALCGGCNGSAAKGDAGVDGGPVDGRHLADVVTSNLLVGTIDASGAPVCITAPLQLMGGQAQCMVVQHVAGDGGVTTTTLQSCDSVGQAPCWTLVTSPTNCPGGGLSFAISLDPSMQTPDPKNLSYDYTCVLGT